MANGAPRLLVQPTQGCTWALGWKRTRSARAGQAQLGPGLQSQSNSSSVAASEEHFTCYGGQYPPRFPGDNAEASAGVNLLCVTQLTKKPKSLGNEEGPCTVMGTAADACQRPA